jgi:hypothetical protein
MAIPANWQNPITVAVGQSQTNINPLLLLPSRKDLSQVRLDIQKMLLDTGKDRYTAIQVTVDGVIWDGHRAIRAAAERQCEVTVQVVNQRANPAASSILDLPVG